MAYDSKYTQAEYVPNELVALQDELSRHPDLLAKAKEGSTFGETLGIVAAELEIVLDGYYSGDDVKNLCVIIKNRLQDRRSQKIGIYTGRQ